MNAQKLTEIITRKNEELERDAVRTAESYIEAILELSQGIKDAQVKIEEYRAELKKLEIQSVSTETILGKV